MTRDLVAGLIVLSILAAGLWQITTWILQALGVLS